MVAFRAVHPDLALSLRDTQERPALFTPKIPEGLSIPPLVFLQTEPRPDAAGDLQISLSFRSALADVFGIATNTRP